MKPNLTMSITLTALIAITTACSDKKGSSGAVGETKATMLALNSYGMSDSCPQVSATYTCDDETGDQDIKIQMNNSGVYVLTMPEKKEEKKSFVDVMVEKYLFDEGGFYLDGKINDKTEGLRAVITTMINGLKFLGSGLEAFGLRDEFKQEFEKLDMNQFKAAYSAGCSKNTINMHYVFGTEAALKFSFVQNPKDLSLLVAAHQLDDNAVKSQVARCVRKADLGMTSAPPASTNNVASYDSTFVFELVNRQNINLSETPSLKFNRFSVMPGSRHLYVFDKAYMGPVDDWSYGIFNDDDISISKPWNMISINMETLKVYGSSAYPGDGIIIGDVIVDGKKLYIDLKVKYSFPNKNNLILLNN